MAGPFEWHLESILRRTEPDVDFALIVLNQPLQETEVVQELWKRGKNPFAVFRPYAVFVSISPVSGVQSLIRQWDPALARIRVASDGAANRLYDLVKKGEKREGASIYVSTPLTVEDSDRSEDG